MRRESAVVARVDERLLEPRDLHLRRSYTRRGQAQIDLRPCRRIRLEPLDRVLSALRAVYDYELRVFARVRISARLKGIVAFARELLRRVGHSNRDHDDLAVRAWITRSVERFDLAGERKASGIMRSRPSIAAIWVKATFEALVKSGAEIDKRHVTSSRERTIRPQNDRICCQRDGDKPAKFA